jgi:hypothetical protein
VLATGMRSATVLDRQLRGFLVLALMAVLPQAFPVPDLLPMGRRRLMAPDRDAGKGPHDAGQRGP